MADDYTVKISDDLLVNVVSDDGVLLIDVFSKRSIAILKEELDNLIDVLSKARDNLK